jgi:hypothetical protein
MSLSKQCKRCKEIKPLEELVKNKGTRDGRGNRCKLCENLIRKEQYYVNHELKLQKAQEYRDKNRDKLNKSNRAYKARNREKLNAWEKEWRKNNPEKSKERAKKYYDSHPNWKKEYYAKNKKYLIERVIKWQKENKEKYYERLHKWKLKNWDKYIQGEIARSKKARENLSDSYVVACMRSKNGTGELRMNDVPKELIEAKRMHLLIKREIKKLNKGEEL